jgi:hypothetical protein
VTAANRRIKITYFSGNIITTTNGDFYSFALFVDAAQVQLGVWGATGGTARVLLLSTPVTPTAGSHTYSVVALRLSGTGTISINPGAGSPDWLLLEDIGPVI